jgi:hypothetical protein
VFLQFDPVDAVLAEESLRLVNDSMTLIIGLIRLGFGVIVNSDVWMTVESFVAPGQPSFSSSALFASM